MFHASSTRVEALLACWPPGPDEVLNRISSSEEGMVRRRLTTTSVVPGAGIGLRLEDLLQELVARVNRELACSAPADVRGWTFGVQAPLEQRDARGIGLVGGRGRDQHLVWYE